MSKAFQNFAPVHGPLTLTSSSPQVLNKTKEFEDAVMKVMRDVNLDNDVVVSVFETNIRVLG